MLQDHPSLLDTAGRIERSIFADRFSHVARGPIEPQFQHNHRGHLSAARSRLAASAAFAAAVEGSAAPALERLVVNVTVPGGMYKTIASDESYALSVAGTVAHITANEAWGAL